MVLFCKDRESRSKVNADNKLIKTLIQTIFQVAAERRIIIFFSYVFKLFQDT